jgi:predicted transcriptional regulator
MQLDDLFDKRSLVAAKLKDCMKERGYTKVSFSKMTNISRPTLDKLLNGGVDNKSTFNRHIQKILAVLDISPQELVFYSHQEKKAAEEYTINQTQDNGLSSKAKKQYDLVMDIVGLCEIYY